MPPPAFQSCGRAIPDKTGKHFGAILEPHDFGIGKVGTFQRGPSREMAKIGPGCLDPQPFGAHDRGLSESEFGRIQLGHAAFRVQPGLRRAARRRRGAQPMDAVADHADPTWKTAPTGVCRSRLSLFGIVDDDFHEEGIRTLERQLADRTLPSLPLSFAIVGSAFVQIDRSELGILKIPSEFVKVKNCRVVTKSCLPDETWPTIHRRCSPGVWLLRKGCR